MNAMELNRAHIDHLLTRVRETTREIKAALKRNDIAQANILASHRLQFISMAEAAGATTNRLTSALR